MFYDDNVKSLDSGDIGIFPEDLVMRIDGDSFSDSTVWV